LWSFAKRKSEHSTFKISAKPAMLKSVSIDA
jgi:hypothetical protein